MTENPITGPNRYTLEDRHVPAIPHSSVMAAIEALGLNDDINDIADIHLGPAEVEVTYYERGENGNIAIRHHAHGIDVNQHTVHLDIDKDK